MRSTGTDSDTGSSILEVSLLMPLFVVMLLGAVQFGWLAYYSIEVKNAAYAGASYGAENHATASNTAAIQLAAADDAANLSAMTVTVTNSCVCSDGTTITCADAVANCTSPARIVEYVQVNTSATLNSLFSYHFPSSYALQGQAIMRVEQ
jgi:Flp pilus assembly protein TadG